MIIITDTQLFLTYPGDPLGPGEIFNIEQALSETVKLENVTCRRLYELMLNESAVINEIFYSILTDEHSIEELAPLFEPEEDKDPDAHFAIFRTLDFEGSSVNLVYQTQNEKRILRKFGDIPIRLSQNALVTIDETVFELPYDMTLFELIHGVLLHAVFTKIYEEMAEEFSDDEEDNLPDIGGSKAKPLPGSGD